MSDQTATPPPPDVALIAPRTCPVCTYTFSAAGKGDQSIATAPPHPGDYAVCMCCAVVLLFTETTTMRVMSNAEWLRLPREMRTQLTEMRERIKTLPKDLAAL
jgi:hypothetical protein